MIYLALGFALGSFTTFAVMVAHTHSEIQSIRNKVDTISCQAYEQGYSVGYWRGRKQGGDKEPSMESLAISPN